MTSEWSKRNIEASPSNSLMCRISTPHTLLSVVEVFQHFCSTEPAFTSPIFTTLEVSDFVRWLHDSIIIFGILVHSAQWLCDRWHWVYCYLLGFIAHGCSIFYKTSFHQTLFLVLFCFCHHEYKCGSSYLISEHF